MRVGKGSKLGGFSLQDAALVLGYVLVNCVGDRNFYTLRDSDQVATKEQWRKAQKDAVVNSLFSAVEPPTYIPPLTPHYAPKRRHKRQANANRGTAQHE
ncbi:hypothetical protein LSTR_LSTR015151 [Laodelphax striatellus]|uniref:Uncharacterized protein n=1 Tax=Laodelphax striatellus TaxID=195883 RepID=A0A482WGP3_LAOST|nr:hypothetical protein LSTR_LSTR015151 [Laodelphax striatellus]